MKIQDIWEMRLPEGQNLEYKRYVFDNGKFNTLPDKEKNKLGQVISSFANSEGGTIVLGITEDENRNPTLLTDVGVTKEEFESWEQSFRQYTSSKIKPVIYGIEREHEEVDDKNLIKIKVPMSLTKPHAINNGSKDELFIRYGNMTNPMLLDDLRTAFEDKNITENKIINFKNERLSMIMGREVIEDLDNEAALVLHLIPEASMNLNSYIDLKMAEHNQKLDVLSPTRRGGSRSGRAVYNMDGLMIFYSSWISNSTSYTHLFHNGSIEVTEVRLMNQLNQHDDHNYIYNWYDLEKILATKIYELSNVMEDIKVPTPYYVFITFLNVKGKQSIVDFEKYPEKPITRNIVKSVPGYIYEGISLEEALYPPLTSLSNVFGLKNSSMYLEDGTPNMDRFDFIK